MWLSTIYDEYRNIRGNIWYTELVGDKQKNRKEKCFNNGEKKYYLPCRFNAFKEKEVDDAKISFKLLLKTAIVYTYTSSILKSSI